MTTRLKLRFVNTPLIGCCWAFLTAAVLLGQQQPGANSVKPATVSRGEEPSGKHPPEPKEKRIFWIVPNFRTSPTLTDYKPLSTDEKFKIASQDAFDRGTFVLAAIFAADGQLTNANPSFGQGVKGYAHYFVTAYGDFAIGDFMTEAVLPSAFHQDPRYFRRGMGGTWSRLGYAMGQIFLTHTDSGGTQFNFSEVGGNAAAVAISNAYYPENRNATDAIARLGTQIGLDMASNILKEFWPDVSRKLSKKHSDRP
jgi:hypothetical protein